MTSSENDFLVWIRRDDHNEDRYHLKYEVRSGKGLFRIHQASGVTSTPASSADIVPALTREEVAGCTLVISNNGRHTYSFANSVADKLVSLPPSLWTEATLDAANQMDFPRHPSPPHPTPAGEQAPGNSVDTAYVRALQADLNRTRKHVQDLKARVSDLEEQVTALGGEVVPLILKHPS